jgi:cytochrome c biogenesis protein CcdA
MAFVRAVFLATAELREGPVLPVLDFRTRAGRVACYGRAESCYGADVSSLWSVLMFGFVLGVRHATDADHVVAVGAIASRERSVRTALLVGVSWGLGHALTVLFVGGAIALFGIVIPPRLGLGMEFAVAMMLVALGLLNIRAAVRGLQSAAQDPAHGVSSMSGVPRCALRSLGVGVLHGLAGSAAVALLVIASMRDMGGVLAYLVVFGVGTIVGMAALTSAFALPVAYASQRFERAQRVVVRVAGALSVACGLVLAYHVGVVEGLFTGAP